MTWQPQALSHCTFLGLTNTRNVKWLPERVLITVLSLSDHEYVYNLMVYVAVNQSPPR